MSTLITEKMISEKKQDEPYFMVVVYADWCGHCQNLKRELGKYFRDYDVIAFLKDDQVKSTETFANYFPFITVFNYGKPRTSNIEELKSLIENYKKSE